MTCKKCEEWRYILGYLTNEDVPTPEGVRKFIMGQFKHDRQLINYIERAMELLNRPPRKDKPYSNAIHCVADLLGQIAERDSVIESLRERVTMVKK